jgi:hypothetical protein
VCVSVLYKIFNRAEMAMHGIFSILSTLHSNMKLQETRRDKVEMIFTGIGWDGVMRKWMLDRIVQHV